MSIKTLLIYEFAFTKLAFIIYNQEQQLKEYPLIHIIRCKN
uniref:Uncharacterized protein n=1 Tax=viral metagenome TaxID=1070528 RepID=A0A6C0HWZ3_9ZZZZ